VAIVGAGPYGLAAAAALGNRRVTVFGRPLQTWRTLMPPTMELRAGWGEMSLTGANGRGSLHEWIAATGRPKIDPMPVAEFIDYAEWFRARYVEDVVESPVESLSERGGRFHLHTASGVEATAAAVVLAVGVTPFAHVPPPFDVDDPRVRLAVDRGDEGELAGAAVAVVGGGQTALEAAAVSVRSGAETELLVRSRVVWFADREPHTPRSAVGRRLYALAYPAVGYGPPPLNRLVLHPDLFARLPPSLRHPLTRRLLRSGGSPWLREQIGGRVKVTEGVEVTAVDGQGASLRLTLSDGSTRSVDRVLLGTGYRFDLDRLAFLSPEIRNQIELADDWPRLDRRFRSTHPGIRFIGYPAEGLFGPSARFVLGAGFAARRLALDLG
jgi:cation diffusion facilitator CzcD-associated flavoprotein CzcO